MLLGLAILTIKYSGIQNSAKTLESHSQILRLKED